MKKRTDTPEHGLKRLWEELEKRRKLQLPISSKQSLAEALGITKQAITPWHTHIPVKHVLQIERLVGIDRTTLRPDVYPPRDGGRGGGKR
jgi:DNA-binding transcriptional regulator YdaS (Cro superfamily)